MYVCTYIHIYIYTLPKLRCQVGLAVLDRLYGLDAGMQGNVMHITETYVTPAYECAKVGMVWVPSPRLVGQSTL